MQLINSAVYDKEKQARAKAMEETRKLKEQRRADREQTKVLRYAQGPAGASVSTSSQQIIVNDVPFKVVRGGSKLVRVSSMSHFKPLVLSGTGSPVLDDPNTANTTPKRVTVAGVTFVRSKNGNLHRLGAVASKRYVLFPVLSAYTDIYIDNQVPPRSGTNSVKDSTRPVSCHPADHLAPPYRSLVIRKLTRSF